MLTEPVNPEYGADPIFANQQLIKKISSGKLSPHKLVLVLGLHCADKNGLVDGFRIHCELDEAIGLLITMTNYSAALISDHGSQCPTIAANVS